MSATIRAAICDDEILVLPYLSSAVRASFQGHGISLELEAFSSAQDLLERAAQAPFAVAFLDIDLPEMDGISLARRLSELAPDTVRVYISAREDRVFDALHTHPFTFIRKSAFQTDLAAAAADISALLIPPQDPICSFQDALGRIHTLNLNRTLYIEAQDKYLSIVTTGDRVLVRHTLSKLEESLEGRQFLRIHKSYLVNYRFIRRFSGEQVILENGQALPLSRRRAAQVRRQFVNCSALPEKELLRI